MPMPAPAAEDHAAAAAWLSGADLTAFYRLPFTVRRAVQQRRMKERGVSE